MIFDRWTYAARVVSVYDGDTVTLDVDLGFAVRFQLAVRVLGIQAPEVAGAGVSPSERQAGLAARDRLRVLLAMGDVFVTTRKDAKEGRGRYLARLQVETATGCFDAGQELVVEGLATPYDGRGKAPKWTPEGWRAA